MALQSGISIVDVEFCTIREVFLAYQAYIRNQKNEQLRFIGLRNDIRGLMGADLIKQSSNQSIKRNEEEIDKLKDRWNDWINIHTN